MQRKLLDNNGQFRVTVPSNIVRKHNLESGQLIIFDDFKQGDETFIVMRFPKISDIKITIKGGLK